MNPSICYVFIIFLTELISFSREPGLVLNPRPVLLLGTTNLYTAECIQQHIQLNIRICMIQRRCYRYNWLHKHLETGIHRHLQRFKDKRNTENNQTSNSSVIVYQGRKSALGGAKRLLKCVNICKNSRLQISSRNFKNIAFTSA